MAHSIIQNFIERACNPALNEPDLALNLEIADLINQKKQNYPRDAAFHIARLINHRNQIVSLLALTLLDICVKNCGYPFHLQVATKDFLNELVRKFPEKPPIVPNPVQLRILEYIQEWRSTLCSTSRHKEDFVHISDMHRLLTFKGYIFPEVDTESVAVLNPAQTLKSKDELEEEDRIVKAAKLQELIRRGTPSDLVEAQELMKIMAGYDPETRPDYQKQADEELERIQRKSVLLNDLLNNVKPGEQIGGDVYEELAQSCKAVQPKIQRLISEEDDSESIDRLLLLNDTINTVLKRYEDISKGIFEQEEDTVTLSQPKIENSSESWLIDLEEPDPPANEIVLTSTLNTDNTVAPNNSSTRKGTAIDDLLVLIDSTLIPKPKFLNHNRYITTKSSTAAIIYKTNHPRKKVPPLPQIAPPTLSAEEAVTNIIYNTPAPSHMPVKRHILNCLVQNEPGVLSRVSGILAARGFNIDSLVVASTEVADLSRMTIVLRGQDDVPVWAVLDYTETTIVERELLLDNASDPIKPKFDEALSPSAALRQKNSHLHALSDLAKLFSGKLVDVSSHSVVIELSAKPIRIDAFLKLVKPFGILEAARSGMMALPRTPIHDRSESEGLLEDEEGEGVDATMLPPG
ncbi:11867_t:CDS:10 [Ambispora gerdemannii]|uniref:11867_t:CDS:1 n=1 Tax=Ambispora gerdemannii TaxID=144530 RepID=A0A9N8VT20_9GLOM|nr:11867_t:CDS:10 [Ambispora gerdemannii]